VHDIRSGNKGPAILRTAYRVPDSPKPRQLLFLVEGKQVSLLQASGDGMRLALLGDGLGITNADADWKKQWRINLARRFPAINVDR
jgi:hypothetical protein